MKYKPSNHFRNEDDHAQSSGNPRNSEEDAPSERSVTSNSRKGTINHLPPSKKYFKVHNLLRKIFKNTKGDKSSKLGVIRTSSVPSLTSESKSKDANNSHRSASLQLPANGEANNNTETATPAEKTKSIAGAAASNNNNNKVDLSMVNTDYETASEEGTRRDEESKETTNNKKQSTTNVHSSRNIVNSSSNIKKTKGHSHKSKGGANKTPKDKIRKHHPKDVRNLRRPSTKIKVKSLHKGKLMDDPMTIRAYNAVPQLEITKLPRGGLSMDTEAVGRVQFGIPPETIKDSMRLGLGVPTVYIVPSERFCREMGPALGVNLAEFEFPAYFNFFVLKRRCTLIVDSEDAEQNIRRVFGETLLGPAQFRRENYPITHEEEDFAPGFPRDAIPNFHKELHHFRIMPNGEELVIETLLKFTHFVGQSHIRENGMLEEMGVPPKIEGEGDHNEEVEEFEMESEDDEGIEVGMHSGPVVTSATSRATNLGVESDGDDENPNLSRTWMLAEAKNISDVAIVFPQTATPEQIKSRSIPRVEIFKLPGGTEYIVHDIDANNNIVGKARFSGHVRVAEGMKIAGFETNVDAAAYESANKALLQGKSNDNDGDGSDGEAKATIPTPVLPPSFHPPSFGVTILGNSHGFDAGGSTSGYVLWVNGRGIMIDPPPYSSATLEREGIRPRTIVGIILTHCHADHDAGAFQKVLTGSPVVVITTPTIYKSFIRKYAALSALSPALLRHSHRHKPAIVGTPLRFQGAIFHFTYTLHTIPCVGFRVEWRGRSMVFTGDHFNSPPAIKMLQEKGVLSKARADDLSNLPLQECDLLLHEAGAPPIHTPLDVLLQLPENVKQRLYVVHTSALPKDCELRVAPTGTAGTIRLDQLRVDLENNSNYGDNDLSDDKGSLRSLMIVDEDRELDYSQYNSSRDRETDVLVRGVDSRIVSRGASILENDGIASSRGLPLAALRPTSSTDAWFTLNLLSSVPFLTSLSYATTMEVLETARVDAYCMNDIVVPANRRRDLLCVVWEGTCMEREPDSGKVKENIKGDNRRYSTFDMDLSGRYEPITEKELKSKKRPVGVWHAGDWTGPRALQPEKRLSGENSTSKTHDIVAMSSEGVKVIKIEFTSLHSILKSGSPLYRKYLARKELKNLSSRNSSMDMEPPSNDDDDPAVSTFLSQAVMNLNLIELFDHNSALRRLSAVQKRHLESLAEGPEVYKPGERLWRAGASVDKAFIIVAGTAAFVPKRRNAGSVGLPSGNMLDTKWDADKKFKMDHGENDEFFENWSLGQRMKRDALKAVRDLESQGDNNSADSDSHSLTSHEDDAHIEYVDLHISDQPPGTSNDFSRLAKSLRKRADVHYKKPVSGGAKRRSSSSEDIDHSDSGLNSRASSHDETYYTEDNSADLHSTGASSHISKTGKKKRNSSRDRFTNKVLGRLYSRRAFTSGLVFSRGHFLGDVSKMVARLLSDEYKTEKNAVNDDSSFEYGFGDCAEGKTDKTAEGIGEMTIHEREGDQLVVHSSTLAAGRDGCAVIYFPKASFTAFLDEYPGLLLSLLGTQVVV